MINNNLHKVKQKNSDVDTLHYQEWLASGVQPEIIYKNVQSLAGVETHEFLLSDAIAGLGEGKKVPASHQYSTSEVTKIRARYQHTLAGGWWCSGLDPLNNWQKMEWGCFKPDQPRKNKEGKTIKYEHPPSTPTRAFFLDIPASVWELVCARYNAAKHGDNFWEWVTHQNIPVIITEGAKKAASLLSLGFVAIGLPGIFGGHRKDPDGRRHLIPELDWLKDREVIICFDQDPKPVTRRNVFIASSQLGKLLSDKKHKCQVRLTGWEYPEKGIDDVLMSYGQLSVEEIICKSVPIAIVQRNQAEKYYKLSPTNTLNCQYLPDNLLLSSSHRLVAIKSPKGTGKSEILRPIIQKAQAEGITVLDCSHRCQLAMAHSQRLGIPYIDSLNRSSAFDKFLDGFSFVIDSLHEQGKASIDAKYLQEFKYYLIIDELEQVLWHLLDSKTEIAKNRAAVIFYMRLLLNNADKVIVLDADLSDICINFIKGCMDCKDDECIIYINEYKLPGYDLFINRDKTPASLVRQAIERFKKGENLLILTDSKSFSACFSSKNLERLFIKKCNLQISDILRIDAESISDPDHPAFGCVQMGVDEIIKKYRVVIASPVIGTGISIDIRDHFSAVYGVFWGVQSCDSVRQHLARLRDNVPRYLWINESGLTRIGNGSSVPRELLDSQNNEFKLNLQILKNIEFDISSDEFSTDCEALNLYTKMAARLNSEVSAYCDIICDRLIQEGHRLQEISPGGDDIEAFREEIKGNRDENYQQELEGICSISVDALAEDDYLKLKAKKAKTQKERQKERKYAISKRYGDCSPEIIAKDDAGWYAQIRLHYYLLNPELAANRDRARVQKELERDRHWQPDLNLWSSRVKLLEVLGVPDLVCRDKITSSNLDQFMRVTDQFRSQIEMICGWLPNQAIARFRKFCSLLGLQLNRDGRQTSGERLWIYAITGFNDGRDKVHQFWITEDNLYQGDTKSVPKTDIFIDKQVDMDVTPPIPSPSPSPSPSPLPAPSPALIPCKVWWWSGWCDALYDSVARIATLLNCDRRVKVFDACQLILG